MLSKGAIMDELEQNTEDIAELQAVVDGLRQ